MIWAPIQEVMYETTSTTELETDQVSKVYDVINKHTIEKMNVNVEFPSKESQMNEFFGNK